MHNAALNSQLQEEVETGDDLPQTPCRCKALISRNIKMSSSTQQQAMTAPPLWVQGQHSPKPSICTLIHSLGGGAPRQKAVPIFPLAHHPCSAPQNAGRSFRSVVPVTTYPEEGSKTPPRGHGGPCPGTACPCPTGGMLTALCGSIYFSKQDR